jgi:hypothetical protein
MVDQEKTIGLSHISASILNQATTILHQLVNQSGEKLLL